MKILLTDVSADPGPATRQALAEIAATSLGTVEAVAVSAVTGQGLDELRAALGRLTSGLRSASSSQAADRGTAGRGEFCAAPGHGELRGQPGQHRRVRQPDDQQQRNSMAAHDHSMHSASNFSQWPCACKIMSATSRTPPWPPLALVT